MISFDHRTVRHFSSGRASHPRGSSAFSIDVTPPADCGLGAAKRHDVRKHGVSPFLLHCYGCGLVYQNATPSWRLLDVEFCGTAVDMSGVQQDWPALCWRIKPTIAHGSDGSW